MSKLNFQFESCINRVLSRLPVFVLLHSLQKKNDCITQLHAMAKIFLYLCSIEFTVDLLHVCYNDTQVIIVKQLFLRHGVITCVTFCLLTWTTIHVLNDAKSTQNHSPQLILFFTQKTDHCRPITCRFSLHNMCKALTMLLFAVCTSLLWCKYIVSGQVDTVHRLSKNICQFIIKIYIFLVM